MALVTREIAAFDRHQVIVTCTYDDVTGAIASFDATRPESRSAVGITIAIVAEGTRVARETKLSTLSSKDASIGYVLDLEALKQGWAVIVGHTFTLGYQDGVS